MIIYLYGPDSYTRNRKLREVTSEYRKKRGTLDFLEVDLEDELSGWELARDFLEQPSMFVRSKMVVIRHNNLVVTSKELEKGEIDSWVGVLVEVSEKKDVFIVVVDEDGPEKDFDFFLRRPVVAQEFEELSGKKLDFFVQIEAKRHGIIFDEKALRFFRDYLMSFRERGAIAVNELEKIFLTGQAGPISSDFLGQIIGWTKKDESFGLVSGFLRANTLSQRMIYLATLFLRNEEPRYLFNLFCSFAREREDVLALARYDEMIKGGSLEDEIALLDLALATKN